MIPNSLCGPEHFRVLKKERTTCRSFGIGVCHPIDDLKGLLIHRPLFKVS